MTTSADTHATGSHWFPEPVGTSRNDWFPLVPTSSRNQSEGGLGDWFPLVPDRPPTGGVGGNRSTPTDHTPGLVPAHTTEGRSPCAS
jgi:hypothetical protein